MRLLKTLVIVAEHIAAIVFGTWAGWNVLMHEPCGLHFALAMGLRAMAWIDTKDLK